MKIRNKRDELSVAGEGYTIIRILKEGRNCCLYLALCGVKMFVLREFAKEDKYLDCVRTHEVLKNIGIKAPSLLAADCSSLICIEQYISGLTAADHIIHGTLCSSFLDQIKAMSELCECQCIALDYYPTNYIIHKNRLVYTGCVHYNLTDDNCYEKKGVLFWMNAPVLIADTVLRKKAAEEQGKK